jgi:hypothetical protein
MHNTAVKYVYMPTDTQHLKLTCQIIQHKVQNGSTHAAGSVLS